ncbi:hypothetical protein PHYC_00762 [Phycisphaerales bacterium]|nr:hypothetical protein PHYC_00762 [Phycisphaerales bacterium]
MRDSNLAVVVCTHVARQRRPILCAVRDTPLDSADSGWQVHCGHGDHSSPDT